MLAIVLGTLAAFFLFYEAALFLNDSPWQKPAALALLLAGLGATWFLAGRLRRSALKKARDAALTKRFGTADPAGIQTLADTYCKSYEAREAAQSEADRRSAAADTLYNTLTANEQALLLEVRRFAPAAFDLTAADELLRSCAVRRKELQAAQAEASRARMRAELLAQSQPETEGGAPAPAAPPTRERSAVEAELAEVRAGLAAARSQADQTSGQLQALGDPAVLASSGARLRQEIQRQEGEYQALLLAREALDQANAALQTRFSPALGRRAAEILGDLTGGRYTGVTLDRAFRLCAEPAGDSLYRDAALLSAGTADQLYLAVRLAICELVLPPERRIPLVLDDALANFDGARCAAALRWLRKEAENRQILLFTCHSREAEFFKDNPAVSIQRLTGAE